MLAHLAVALWLLFDGCFARFSAGTDAFFRMGYSYMILPNGNPVSTYYSSGFNYIDLTGDGNYIQLSSGNFGLGIEDEDYVIVTISYPVESKE